MINYIKNQIKADKNSKLLVEIVNYLNDNIEKCSNLAIEISKLYEKVNNISGITVDTELDKNSNNAVSNSAVTTTTDNINKSINQIKKALLLTDSNLSELEEKVNNLQIEGGTGVQYQNSTLIENVHISATEIANVASCEITGKVLPISITPMDTSATWRMYCLRSFIYNDLSNSTIITFLATDTSTNVNVTVMNIIESEG